MRVAYVAGPYRSATEHGIFRNIRAAEEVALELWAMGFAVICPHKNCAHLGGAKGLPDETWLNGDLELISRSDLVVVVPYWKTSNGTLAEIEFAQHNDIPVMYWPKDKPAIEEFAKAGA